MVLRLLQVGNALPFSYIVDPNATFQPGMVGQLNLFGNQIVCGVSDGTAPIGIIDDIKTNAFSAPSIDEVIIVPATGVGNPLVTPIDIKAELANANVLAQSFIADVDVALNPVNGVITIPAGTQLNFDLAGNGQDSVRIVCSYTYRIPNIPGDDSTLASGRVTVWFNRMIFETDQFETNQRYPLNANLFVSEIGLLTTRQPTPNHAAVAFVTAPPTTIHGSLGAMWL